MSELDVVGDVRRGRWIDWLLVAGGVAVVVAGWPAIGAGLVVAGLIAPARSWFVHRRSAAHGVAYLVPSELARAHADVVALAVLPGVIDGEEIVDAADDLVLEVAAVLGGGPARGAVQRRFVAARLHVLEQTASDLRDRQEALLSARAEVDALSPADLVEPANAPREGGALVGLLVVVLAPAFLAWDATRALGRGIVHLVEGIVLRVRMAGRLIVRGVELVVSALSRVREAWTELRVRLVDSVRQARARFVAARVRVRLAVRRARRLRRRA